MTVRLRLTLLYGLLFLAAGAILLSLNYALASRNLPTDQIAFVSRTFPGEAGAGAGADVVANGDPLGPIPLPAAKAQPVDPNDPAFVPPQGPVFGYFVVNGEKIPTDPTLITRLPLQVRKDALHTLLIQSLAALGVMAVISAGLGWLVAGRVLRPLAAVTATARRLSERNLHERIDVRGPRDELRELGATFNGMLARLDTAFESQRRFVANASHELRTPLAIIRTEVDVTVADPGATTEQLRVMADRVRVAVERSERLLDSLLTLARSERGVEHWDFVDLAATVTHAVGDLRALAQHQALRVESRFAPVVVLGDETLLERLACNLVDNAIKYNQPDGWVNVELLEQEADGSMRAQLRVSNSGPVVTAADVDQLFEPFRRAGRDRLESASGAGLGLSIVRAVALAHGGTVTARAFERGGLEVLVDLPAVTNLDAAVPPADPVDDAGPATREYA